MGINWPAQFENTFKISNASFMPFTFELAHFVVSSPFSVSFSSEIANTRGGSKTSWCESNNRSSIDLVAPNPFSQTSVVIPCPHCALTLTRYGTKGRESLRSNKIAH